MDDPPAPAPVPKRRLVVYFVILGIFAGGVAIAVIAAGKNETPEPAIAGGYDVSFSNPCLGKAGQQFDLKQSGQFITLQNTGGGPSGKLRFRSGRLTGTVDCAGGGSGQLTAVV